VFALGAKRAGKKVTSVSAPSNGHAVSFGPFRLLTAQRRLLEGDEPIRLGRPALDILTALIERAGEVVSKQELIARTWPQTFVAEANLKIQISGLRRRLGDGQGGHRYIATVPGRGYSFVAPVRLEQPLRPAQSETQRSAAEGSAAAHNLPFAVARMIGREEAVAALVARLSHQRLLTIVGPGGIGKSTVALALAERLIATREHGVWLIDLAPLGDRHLVPSAVATVLGLEVRSDDPLPGLVTDLMDKRMLLVLDNCEHLIDAAANLAAAVLRGAPGIEILATSREPLGVAGEWEYRLGPLDTPQPSSTLTGAGAAAFPAVQLFVERVIAIIDDFELTDANAPMVVEICRRLDGLPLAIEFVAPRVAVLGVEGLAAVLKDSLPLLAAPRRAAVPRHRTMQAVVDWSYGLLSQDEQRFFRALGIFAGSFTDEAAAAVALEAAATDIDAMDRLAGLVTKSLVVADVSGANPRFRLLQTIRAFAIMKMDESGERDQIARCHAEYCRDLFERAGEEAGTLPSGEWLARYGPEVDSLRVALDWAFSPAGDRSIGVALTVAALPLWMRLSLLEECRRRAKQALGALATAGDRDLHEEMRLHAALGASTSEATEMGAAFTKALAIAETLGDSEYRLRALSGLYFFHTGSGRYRAALPFAQHFHDLALSGSNANDRLIGARIMGTALHFFGDQINARRHLEQVLAWYGATNHRWDRFLFQADLRVVARTFLARVLWLQGFPDQAVGFAEMSVKEAQATGHQVSLCMALALAACPTALWVGNLEGAARYTAMLLDCSRRHRLPLWSEFGSRFQKAVVIKQGDPNAELQLMRDGPDETVGPSVRFRSLTGLTELAEALAQAGRIAIGLACVEAGIEHCEAGWGTPELLRLKGELLLLQSASAAAHTEGLFEQALDRARQDAALSWELRAATSLARLLYHQGQPADAIACLQPVYARFTEGFGTADLIAAKRLLRELHSPGRS
jgi:predicted ATPase/DNA-binding winged helix-turn-helix (wHTH) protein